MCYIFCVRSFLSFSDCIAFWLFCFRESPGRLKIFVKSLKVALPSSSVLVLFTSSTLLCIMKNFGPCPSKPIGREKVHQPRDVKKREAIEDICDIFTKWSGSKILLYILPFNHKTIWTLHPRFCFHDIFNDGFEVVVVVAV